MTAIVQVGTGPRLQAGDLLDIKGRVFWVARLSQSGKATVFEVRPQGGSREFIVTADFGLRHRRRSPRLPHTSALLAQLRAHQSTESPSPQVDRLVADAAAEHCLSSAVDRHGQFALTLASSKGMVGLVIALLRRGCRTDVAEPTTGDTALIKAARHGHRNVIDALLAAGSLSGTPPATPFIDAVNFSGYSALMACVAGASGANASGSKAASRRACVELLLQRRANVHIRETATRDLHDALRLACCSGRSELVQLLAAYGADVTTVNPNAAAVSPLGEWLRARRSYVTPLHYIEGMSDQESEPSLTRTHSPCLCTPHDIYCPRPHAHHRYELGAGARASPRWRRRARTRIAYPWDGLCALAPRDCAAARTSSSCGRRRE